MMRDALLFTLCIFTFAVNAEGNLYTTTCQFLITEESKTGILFESPSGCASALAEQIKETRFEENKRGSFRINTTFVSEHFEKVEPPKCPDGYLPIGDVKRKIVDATVYSFHSGFSNQPSSSTRVLFEATRYCEKTD